MIVGDRDDVVTIDEGRWITLQVLLFGLALVLGLGMVGLVVMAIASGGAPDGGTWGCLAMGLLWSSVGGYGTFSRTWLEVDGSTRTVRRVSTIFGRRSQGELSPGRIVRVAVRPGHAAGQYETRFETNEMILGMPRVWPAFSSNDVARSNEEARRMAELLGVAWLPYGAEPGAPPEPAPKKKKKSAE